MLNILTKRIAIVTLLLLYTMLVGPSAVVTAQGECLGAGDTVCTTNELSLHVKSANPTIVLTDADADVGEQVEAWLEMHKNNDALNTRVGQTGSDLVLQNLLNDGDIRLLLDEDDPGHVLIERGGLMIANPANPGANYKFDFANDIARLRIGGSGPGANNGFLIADAGDGLGSPLLRIWGNGRVAVGTNVEPQQGIKFRVTGGGIQSDRILVDGTTTTGAVDINGGDLEVANPSNADASVRLGFADDVARLRIGGSGAGANNGLLIADAGEGLGSPLLRIWGNGKIAVGTNNQPPSGIKFEVTGGDIKTDGITVEGTTTTNVLQITGGADLAEPFAVNESIDIEPGTVVVLDVDNPGELRVAQRAYDPLVAGVISGAGGIQPGLIMQQDTEAKVNGAIHPVALTGKVYVKAVGPIKIGDLLTTSDISGHAMAATDRDKAFGATLGKAMSSLAEGETGLVLVLVALN